MKTSSWACLGLALMLESGLCQAPVGSTGRASGTDISRPYPIEPGGVPLLTEFHIEYAPEAGDRHVRTITVLPGFLNPARLAIGLADDSGDDPYIFRVRHHVYTSPEIQAFTHVFHGGLQVTHRGFSPPFPDARPIRTPAIPVNPGKWEVILHPPTGRLTNDLVFVLIGFQLSFFGDDRHIDEITILESAGTLTVSFNDQNDDDPFNWIIQYAYVPRALTAGRQSRAGRRARGAAHDVVPWRGVSVIQGFRLKFEPYFHGDLDHHLAKIGVRTQGHISGGRFMHDRIVTYADQNGDDGFDWLVRVAFMR